MELLNLLLLLPVGKIVQWTWRSEGVASLLMRSIFPWSVFWEFERLLSVDSLRSLKIWPWRLTSKNCGAFTDDPTSASLLHLAWYTNWFVTKNLVISQEGEIMNTASKLLWPNLVPLHDGFMMTLPRNLTATSTTSPFDSLYKILTASSNVIFRKDWQHSLVAICCTQCFAPSAEFNELQ